MGAKGCQQVRGSRIALTWVFMGFPFSLIFRKMHAHPLYEHRHEMNLFDTQEGTAILATLIWGFLEIRDTFLRGLQYLGVSIKGPPILGNYHRGIWMFRGYV